MIPQNSKMTSPAVSSERLAATVADLSARLDRAERRLRVAVGVMFAAITVAVIVPVVSPVVAQENISVVLPPLARLATLEAKTASMSVLTDPNTKQPTVRFSGVNVQVVSGSGETYGDINGKGNLIVGYNETRLRDNIRTGSHNLIVGTNNNYDSRGGVAFGHGSYISGYESTVLGGSFNTASGVSSTVSGGTGNTASNDFSTVSGGIDNTASGLFSSVSGGNQNTAIGMWSSVSGGSINTASGRYASISGGTNIMQNKDYGFGAGGDGGDNKGVGVYHAPKPVVDSTNDDVP